MPPPPPKKNHSRQPAAKQIWSSSSLWQSVLQVRVSRGNVRVFPSHSSLKLSPGAARPGSAASPTLPAWRPAARTKAVNARPSAARRCRS